MWEYRIVHHFILYVVQQKISEKANLNEDIEKE